MAGALKIAREGAGPMVPCACQCGGTLQQFDHWGRERKYLPGHQSRVLWRRIRASLTK